jgi:gluconate 2-dehydrogenase gamma chain
MKDISRREFLVRSAVYGGGLWVTMNIARPRALAAAAASSEPTVLSREQWATVEAITARIIPTDDTPGALEAGCVNFIDKALAHEDSELGPRYVEGLEALDGCARARAEKRFVELPAAEQDALLAQLQDGTAAEWKASFSSVAFFDMVRVHTVFGFLADPKHGGNRDYAGWKAIGYPGAAHHRGGYTPAQMLGEQKVTPVWEDE